MKSLRDDERRFTSSLKRCVHAAGALVLNGWRMYNSAISVAEQGLWSFNTEVLLSSNGAQIVVEKAVRSPVNAHGVTELAELKKNRELVLTLGPGIKEGTRLKVLQKGIQGLSGCADGDLYITIRLEPHPEFVREDNDLHYEVEIDFVQAILGITMEAPMLNGQAELKVSSYVQLHQLLRLREKGLPNKVAVRWVMCTSN